MFTFSSLILLVPIRVLSVVIQYVREYYFKTKDHAVIHFGFIDLLFLFIVLNTILILISKEFVFYLLKYYLIEYQVSYDFVNPMFAVSYFIGAFHILSAYFVIVSKTRYTLISVSVAFIFSIVFNFVAVYFYNTLYAISMATLLSGFVLFGIVLYFFIVEGVGGRRISNLRIGFMLCIFIIICSVFAFLPTHIFNGDPYTNTLTSLQSLLVVMLVIILLVLYFKKLNLNSLRRMLAR